MTAPSPTLPVNEGERPDLLTLGRQATGELPGPVPADYDAALADARASLPPLDVPALRDRAATLDPREDAANARRGGRGWLWLGAPLALAAAGLLAVRADLAPAIRTKGFPGPVIGAGCDDCLPGAVEGWVLQGDTVSAIDADTVVAPGDRVRLAIPETGRATVVVLNVDGTGHQQVFWPATPDAPPVPLAAEGPTLLTDSVELDDAPGPEAFVAVFDVEEVDAAADAVADAWAGGGLAALRTLADTREDVALMVLPKVHGAP